MRSHSTYLITQSDTRRYTNNYINDALSETSTHIPARRTTGFPTALTVLALGLSLAILVMLGTWLSLSTRATARITTFVAHPEEQTLSADELEDIDLPPAFLADLLSRF